VLTDRRGRRYLLDNTGVRWEFFRIENTRGQVRLVWPGTPLLDQNGIFRVEAETDPQAWEVWGYHRSSRWDFDRSGRQHLVVGTDKGLLYLLVEEPRTMDAPPFRFRSVGPLADRTGKVIRVHNRAVAAGVDLDGNGREDLVVGGISYQLGIPADPEQGGGFYYLLQRGLDAGGLPILEPLQPLPLEGYRFGTPINTHVQIQAVDLDQDGAKEVILASQRPDSEGRVFRPVPGRPALRFTGKVVPGYLIEHHLDDLDGDGALDLVFGGGEQGVGYYRKLRF
jgi:hypothetical protein